MGVDLVGDFKKKFEEGILESVASETWRGRRPPGGAAYSARIFFAFSILFTNFFVNNTIPRVFSVPVHVPLPSMNLTWQTQAQFGYTCVETWVGLIAWVAYWAYPVLVMLFNMRMLCFRYSQSIPEDEGCTFLGRAKLRS